MVGHRPLKPRIMVRIHVPQPTTKYKMKNKKPSIYTSTHVIVASFIGGPFVGVYMIGQNFKTLGNKSAAIKTWLIGTSISFLMLVGFIFLPTQITKYIPSFLIPMLYSIVLFSFTKSYQEKNIKEYLKEGKQASWVGTIALSILSLIVTLGIILVFYFSNVFFNYSNYLKGYCNVDYKEEDIQASKIYYPEEASCYVYSKVKDRGYTLDEVDKVLTLEYEYQQESGLIGSSEGAVKGYNPVPYISEHQTSDLSVEEIKEILTQEENYLKLIGVSN